jgi:iron complex transport system ATP-binding protein
MISALELKKINFSYEKKEFLKNFSLTIEAGEFFGIIGPNGSGKTTILKIMAGLLKPQNGEVLITGKDIIQIKRDDIAKTIGFVPQENFFAFEFSVLDVVLWGRNPYLKRFEGPKRIDFDKAIQALTLVDILPLKDKSINRISAGERQRVVLARALAQEPKILLLDEPTAHLDITHQVEFIKLLQAVRGLPQAKTIVFLSHDLNLASLVCSRILLLDNGKSVACDKPEIVLKSELIERVYKIKPYLQNHPETSTPQIILPLS